MAHPPLDTTPQAWTVLKAGLKAMTPEERVRKSFALTAMTHRVALAGIRARFPQESSRQHRLRLAATYIDAETMRAAFDFPGPDDGP